jgi:hypothetical protein
MRVTERPNGSWFHDSFERKENTTRATAASDNGSRTGFRRPVINSGSGPGTAGIRLSDPPGGAGVH